MLVAGVDGCRAGWIGVLREVHDPGGAELRLFRHFADVLAAVPPPGVIAVDIPIGLPERSGRGGRHCDVAARANLGARLSSVFAMPSRAAVLEADYRDACAAAFATSDPPRRVSKQAFNLFGKIREVDSLLTPDLQNRVVECHPELAFWALNGGRPLDIAKKVKSRPHEAGLELRRGLLASAGYAMPLLTGAPFAARDCGPDDILDAAVCSWSAVRIALGNGQRFPDTPGVDVRGLRMEIWC